MGSEFSRRRFLILGATAAGVALVPAGAVTAAATGPAKNRATSRFPYALASWQEAGSGPLRVDLPHGRSTTLRLKQATDLGGPSSPSDQGDQFSLTFAVHGPLPSEGTHTVSHTSLGTFPLFLSPINNGRVTALVNRSRGVHHR
jgi:hypothetical protein